MVKNFKAAEGKCFPLKYKGKVMFISSDQPQEIDTDKIDYVTKIQLNKAIEDKEVIDVSSVKKGNK